GGSSRVPPRAGGKPGPARLASTEEPAPAASPAQKPPLAPAPVPPEALAAVETAAPVSSTGADAAVAREPRPSDRTGEGDTDQTPAAERPRVPDRPRAAEPPRVTEPRTPKASSAIDLPPRSRLAPKRTGDDVEGAKAASSERTALWMIETHGRSFAEERAEAAAKFYRPEDAGAQFWTEVLRHIREAP